MLNLLGACCIVASLTVLGDIKARGYVWRLRQLQQLQQGLRLLITEVSYTATLLPYAFLSIARRVEKPVNHIFKSAGRCLLDAKDMTAREAWDQALKENKGLLSLAPNDLEIVKRLGSTLGVSDVEGQIKQIELTLEQLGHAVKEAEDMRHQNERMWRYLGFLGGLVLVILFL